MSFCVVSLDSTLGFSVASVTMVLIFSKQIARFLIW